MRPRPAACHSLALGRSEAPTAHARERRSDARCLRASLATEPSKRLRGPEHEPQLFGAFSAVPQPSRVAVPLP